MAAPDERDSTSAATVNSSIGAQRLREELRVLLMDLVQSGTFGNTPADKITLTLDIPAGRVADLGVLVDSSSGESADNGLLVLGTTPGSLSSRIGLRSGDALLAVNDRSLVALGSDSSGAARAAHSLREALDSLDDGAALEFRISRDGKQISLEGKMESVLIPSAHLQLGQPPITATTMVSGVNAEASSGSCGRISTFDNAPRQQQLHAATLIDIDGRQSPIFGQTSVRVSAGQHTLKVGEQIDLRYLGFGQRLRDRGGSERYKTITVNVEADTTYLLAAKINSEHRNEWRDGAYWDPVIWSTSKEKCR
ncbi:MAG: PDZ domain-containing protein [Dokdonella sp.]